MYDDMREARTVQTPLETLIVPRLMFILRIIIPTIPFLVMDSKISTVTKGVEEKKVHVDNVKNDKKLEHADKTSEANTKAKIATNEKQKKSSFQKKRKKPPSTTREGTRKSARSAPRAQPSQTQLLKYMLSKDAENLCRPDDEARALASSDIKKTYTSSVLNPFQELVCAVVLSRPISHMLGLRTIRTLFNPPYEFTSAKRMRDAGTEKVRQALWDARTQHKAKTADQLSYLADLVMERYTSEDDKHGENLGGVISQSDVENTLQNLMRSVKGLGPTGCDIFRRRVQWLWEAAYPFVDSKSGKSLRELGLPDDGEQLRQILEEHWDECDTVGVAGRDEDERHHRGLMVVVERATGAGLEGKIENLKSKAVAV